MTPIVEIVNLKKRYPPVVGAKEGQLAVNRIYLKSRARQQRRRAHRNP